jgi:hypothetical protein
MADGISDKSTQFVVGIFSIIQTLYQSIGHDEIYLPSKFQVNRIKIECFSKKVVQNQHGRKKNVQVCTEGV